MGYDGWWFRLGASPYMLTAVTRTTGIGISIRTDSVFDEMRIVHSASNSKAYGTVHVIVDHLLAP